MSENIRFTKKQISFLMEYTDESSPETAAERFIQILTEEKADIGDVVFYIDKIMQRIKK